MSPHRFVLTAPLALVLLAACDETKMATRDSPAPSPENAEVEAAPSDEPAAEEAQPVPAKESAKAGDEAPSEPPVGATGNAPTKAHATPPVGDKLAAEKAPTGPVVGLQATASASVKADEGYKCNDAFPHKFTAKGGANVDYPSPKVSGSCSGTEAVAVSVPYVPTAAGPGRVEGELKYGICDDDKTNCRIMKKPVTVAFTAAPK